MGTLFDEGKGTHQGDADMVEVCIVGIEGANRCFVVASDAAPRPLGNILLQSIPCQTFHGLANGGLAARMGKTTWGVEDLSSACN